MREIFSVRFFAAVGAVAGLFFLLTTIFATREVIDDGGGDDDGPTIHRIDFVEHVAAVSNPDFALNVDGVAANDTVLFIDESRSLQIVADTPGVNHCPRFPVAGACAVVADLLGEGVVWFAFVPAGPNRTVDFPAIDTLDDGFATLVNGWQLAYAPVLDRRCDDEFTSYREFRDVLGDDFTSIYDIEDRRLAAVRCEERVAYAPIVDVSTDGEGDLAAEEDDPIPSLPGPGDDPDASQRLALTLSVELEGRSLDAATAALSAAGWSVRAIDADDPTATLTADINAGRVTITHRDGVVIQVAVG